MEKRARRNWLIAIWVSGVFVAVSAVAALLRDRIRDEVKEAEAESPDAIPEPKSSDSAATSRSTLAA